MLCIGPAAEFLTIIAHDDDTPAIRRRKRAQRFDSFGGWSPGDSIAQRRACREHLQYAALIFSGVVAVEVAVFQPEVLEMGIIQDGPFYPCFAQQARQARLP